MCEKSRRHGMPDSTRTLFLSSLGRNRETRTDYYNQEECLEKPESVMKKIRALFKHTRCCKTNICPRQQVALHRLPQRE